MRTKDQVLSLIMQGLSNKEIADIACVTESGVKYHIAKLFKKYNVNNRSKLIAEIQKSKSLYLSTVKDQSDQHLESEESLGGDGIS